MVENIILGVCFVCAVVAAVAVALARYWPGPKMPGEECDAHDTQGKAT